MKEWERAKATWQHVFFAAVLGITTLGAVTEAGNDAPTIAVRILLAAGLGAWYCWWFVRRRTSTANPAYLIGAAVLWAAMAATDPVMLLVGVAALVPYAMRHALWSAVGVVVLGSAWLSQLFVTRGALDWRDVLACALGTVATVAIAGYIGMLQREGRKQQLLLDELAAAQAELAATEREAGVLAERQRLARDIHDTLTQGFASISMLLDAALADMPPEGPAPRRVTQAMHTARENLAEARRMIDALRPMQLDRAHLADALGDLTRRLAADTGLSAHTVVNGKPAPLSADAEAQLLRVVQEAVTNARRHAAAESVTVTLTYLDGTAIVDIQDDGAGFDPDAASRGMGLATMRERTQGLGGTLTVESSPGEGTTVVASVPTATTGTDRLAATREVLTTP